MGSWWILVEKDIFLLHLKDECRRFNFRAFLTRRLKYRVVSLNVLELPFTRHTILFVDVYSFLCKIALLDMSK